MRGAAQARGTKRGTIVLVGIWLALAGVLMLPLTTRAQATPGAAACARPTPVATLVPGDGTGAATPAATPAPVGLATPAVADCLHVTLTIDKKEAGPRVLSLAIREGNGKPVAGATVTVQTQSLEMDHGISSYPAKMTKPGVYVASDVSLGMSGKWQVNVFIGLPDGGRAEAVFVFSLA